MNLRTPFSLTLALMAAAATTGCPSVADTTKLLSDLQKATASAAPSPVASTPASTATSATTKPADAASPAASTVPAAAGTLKFTSFYWDPIFGTGDVPIGFNFALVAGEETATDTLYAWSTTAGTLKSASGKSNAWTPAAGATGDVVITVLAGGAKGSVTGKLTLSFKQVAGWAITKVELPDLKGAPEDFTGCFVAGTPVRLADGREVPIERIQVGDTVQAYNQETHQAAPAKVERVLVHNEGQHHLTAVRTADGHALQATANHPILTPGGWKQVAELAPGDTVYVFDGAAFVETKIVSIVRDEAETGVVYNLKTSLHDYVAAEILVHNKCLAAGAPIESPTGPVAVEDLKPGMLVYGYADGQRVATRVTNVFSKVTTAEALPGKRLTPRVAVTVNHLVMRNDRFSPAGFGPWEDEDISGQVYDVQTTLGNYYCDGIVMTASGEWSDSQPALVGSIAAG
ncbi:MAG: hypothetical protein JWM80_601 [Cyanobacteria bacterium RYN_339]|nr:hypothetical protein [Cyanobacteria bacterium RYN_339]